MLLDFSENVIRELTVLATPITGKFTGGKILCAIYNVIVSPSDIKKNSTSSGQQWDEGEKRNGTHPPPPRLDKATLSDYSQRVRMYPVAPGGVIREGREPWQC